MKTQLKLATLLPKLSEGLKAEVVKVLEELKAPALELIEVKRRAIANDVVVGKEDERTITMRISTRNMDRDREIVMPKGGDFRQYMHSGTGVVIQNHNYASMPVARCDAIEANDDCVMAKIKFAPTEQGENLWTLAKFMPLSASIGFIPLDWIDKAHPDWEKTTKKLAKDWPEFEKSLPELTRIIRKWLLLEVSIVPVPANPFAVQESISKAFADGAITEAEAAMVCKTYCVDVGEVIQKTQPPAPPMPPVPPKQTPPPSAPSIRIVSPVIKIVGTNPMSCKELQETVLESVEKTLARMRGRV
jgi:hypothetical protein